MKKLHAGSLRSYYTIQGVRLQFRCHTLPGVPQPCILLASTEEFRRLFGFGYTFRAAIGHRNSSSTSPGVATVSVTSARTASRNDAAINARPLWPRLRSVRAIRPVGDRSRLAIRPKAAHNDNRYWCGRDFATIQVDRFVGHLGVAGEPPLTNGIDESGRLDPLGQRRK